MREQIDFEEETVVVTGGASAIGRTIGSEFAREGADVTLADIDDERGEAAADEIADDHGVATRYHHTDVSSLGACEDLMAAVEDELDGVDVLVNVAAVAAPDAISKPFLEETTDDWAAQLQVTLMGAVNPSHAALPYMVEQRDGAIVNFSSESRRGQDTRLAMYGAAKSGVATFTRTLADEFGSDGVRINAVSPSTTRTEATEEWLDRHADAVVENHALDRLGRPADHANAAVFLASDAADWITGQVLSVNGGYF